MSDNSAQTENASGAKQPILRRRWKLVASILVILAVGLVVSFETYRKTKSDEIDAIYGEFHRAIDDRMATIEAGFNGYLRGLAQLASGLAESPRRGEFPTYEQFKYHVDTYEDSYRGLNGVGLMLNVTDDKRAAYEEFMVTQQSNPYAYIPNTGIRTVDRIAVGTLDVHAAENASSYLPVTYFSVNDPVAAQFQDLVQNTDVKNIGGVGDEIHNGIENDPMGCSVNRFEVSILTEKVRMFALFCPFRSSTDPLIWQELSPEERIQSYFGGAFFVFSGERFVQSALFTTASIQLAVIIEDLNTYQWDNPDLPATTDTDTVILAGKHSTVSQPKDGDNDDGGPVLGGPGGDDDPHKMVSLDAAEAAQLVADAGRFVVRKDFKLTTHTLRFTFAALPEFISSRATQGPAAILALSLSLVCVLLVLFILSGTYLHLQERRQTAAQLEKQKQQSAIIRAAKEAHERTIAYACHQLRNPLQAVLGSVDFLRERFTRSDDCYEDVAAISTGALDMKKVIDDISDWVNVSVGRLQLNLQPTRLSSLVTDVLSRHKNFVNPSLVKLSAEVDPACSAFAFQLDADRVKQVLTNGLLNAIRATLSGSVTISVKPKQFPLSVGDVCDLVFKVTDTGHGFGNQDPRRLFDPVYWSNGDGSTSGPDGVVVSYLSLIGHHHDVGLDDESTGTGDREDSPASAGASRVSISTGRSGRSTGSGLFSRLTHTVRHFKSNSSGDSRRSARIHPAPVLSGGDALMMGRDVERGDVEPGFDMLNAISPASHGSDGDRRSGLPTVPSLPHAALRPGIRNSAVPNTMTGSGTYGTRSAVLTSTISSADGATLSPSHGGYTHGTGSGLGIGLPMSKQIVEMMKGTISLARRGDNTVFSFTVPCSVVALTTPPPRAGSGTVAAAIERRIGGVTALATTALRLSQPVTAIRSVPSRNTVPSLMSVAEAMEQDDLDGGGEGDVVVMGDVVDGVGESKSGDPIIADTVVVPVVQEAIPVSVQSTHHGMSMLTALHQRPSVLLAFDDPPAPSSSAPASSAVVSVPASARATSPPIQVTVQQPQLLPPPSKVIPVAVFPVASGPRVLVVDDEKPIRRLCQRMLEKLGCTCVLLDDGDEVLRTLLQAGYKPENSDGAAAVVSSEASPLFQPFDVILMDVMMMRSNGVEVVADLKRRFSGSNTAEPSQAISRGNQLKDAEGNDDNSVLSPMSWAASSIASTAMQGVAEPSQLPPIVAMTANTSLSDLMTYRRVGFSSVLGKPFSVESLRAKLQLLMLGAVGK